MDMKLRVLTQPPSGIFALLQPLSSSFFPYFSVVAWRCGAAAALLDRSVTWYSAGDVSVPLPNHLFEANLLLNP